MTNLQDFAESDELRRQLRNLQVKVRDAKEHRQELIDAVYTASRDALAALGPVLPVAPPPPDRRKKPEVALIHATDWQRGKRTQSYNSEICDERVNRLADKIFTLTKIARSDHPVNSAAVLFGGDMLEGVNIFPGQTFEIDSWLYDQFFGLIRLEERFIRRLLSEFETVEIWAEPGNHGRIGRSKSGDFPAADNMDNLSYGVAKMLLENEPRVIWHPYHSWYQPVQIGNYKAMLIHGDEIKSFGGNTPAFGLLRKGTAWSSGVVEEGFQDIYFGHFHTPMTLTLPNGGQMYGTGSTESSNAYAAEFVAAKGKPSQRLHFIEPEKGHVTAEYRLWLD